MSQRLPSIRALRSADDRLLADELRVATLKSQSAVVRTLLDEIDRAVPQAFAAVALREQLVEELTRLGARVFDAAAAIATKNDVDALQESGVHEIPFVTDR